MKNSPQTTFLLSLRGYGEIGHQVIFIIFLKQIFRYMEANESNEKPKKVRKVSQGPIREKARTMRKLIDAVGKVLEEKGYPGLNIANISKEAKVDRKLVYVYFGGIDPLVETYIKGKDFWKADSKEYIKNLLENPNLMNKEVVNELLQLQFSTLLSNVELQKIIHWEIGEKNDVLRKIADEREEIGEKLFEHAEKDFTNSDLDLRAIMALQIGGIYYLSLHAKSNGSKFCGIDLNTPEGEKRIEKAIQQVIDLTYNTSTKPKKASK